MLIVVESLLHASSHPLRHGSVVLHHYIVQHAVTEVGVQLKGLKQHLDCAITVGCEIGIQHIHRDAGKHCRPAPVQICCILFLEAGKSPFVIGGCKRGLKSFVLKLKGVQYIVIAAAVVLFCPVVELFLLFPLIVREHSSFALQIDAGIHYVHAAGGGFNGTAVRGCGSQHIHHLKHYRKGIAYQDRVIVLHKYGGRIARHILGHGVYSHFLD